MSDELENRVRALEHDVGQLRAALETHGIVEPGSHDLGEKVRGYVVWGGLFALIMILELVAAFGLSLARWPTVFGTIASLGVQGTLLLAVAIAVYTQMGAPRPYALSREKGGKPVPNRRVIPGRVYFPLAIAGVIVAVSLAEAISAKAWPVGVALYGSLAAFFLLIPNALAYWDEIDVPFPTLSQTLSHLERDYRFGAFVAKVGTGLIRPPSR